MLRSTHFGETGSIFRFILNVEEPYTSAPKLGLTLRLSEPFFKGDKTIKHQYPPASYRLKY